MTTAESILRATPKHRAAVEAQAASGLSKALTRPRSHGGKRAGAGRKAILDGAVRRTYWFTQAELDAIERWRITHNCASQAAALRDILATVDQRTTVPVQNALD